MDPVLSRRYLEAVGVTSWRLRQTPSGEPLEAPPQGISGLGEAPPAPERHPMSSLPQSSGPAPPGTPAEMDWDSLGEAVASCRACALCETRTNTVFGVGDRNAGLMIIGEAPGAEEDRQGEPFVGRAGQLLDRMLAAIGFAREQVYIANILKCRPPGNRDPRPEEALRCEPFLVRQITLVRPRVLLAVGKVSAQRLLGTDAPVGRLRGRWFEQGPQGVPLRVTYHPSYLLRSPEQKGKAWQDLLEVARMLHAAE
jgi:DNA polymerase